MAVPVTVGTNTFLAFYAVAAERDRLCFLSATYDDVAACTALLATESGLASRVMKVTRKLSIALVAGY